MKFSVPNLESYHRVVNTLCYFLLGFVLKAILGARINLSITQFTIKVKSKKGEYVDVAYSIYLCISKYTTREVVDLMVHPQASIMGLICFQNLQQWGKP